MCDCKLDVSVGSLYLLVNKFILVSYGVFWISFRFLWIENIYKGIIILFSKVVFYKWISV